MQKSKNITKTVFLTQKIVIFGPSENDQKRQNRLFPQISFLHLLVTSNQKIA